MHVSMKQQGHNGLAPVHINGHGSLRMILKRLWQIIPLLLTVQSLPTADLSSSKATARPTRQTCGFSNGTVHVYYLSKHAQSQVLGYKLSELSGDATRILPWNVNGAPVVKCRLRRGSTQCRTYYSDGGLKDVFFVGKENSTVAWDTVTRDFYEYEPGEPGFYCLEVSVNDGDEFPYIEFHKDDVDIWRRVVEDAGTFFDVVIVLAVSAWTVFSYSNNAVGDRFGERKAWKWDVSLVALATLLVYKGLTYAVPHFWAVNTTHAAQKLTILFGSLKALAMSAFAAEIIVLTFVERGLRVKELAFDAAIIAAPLFVFLTTCSIEQAHYTANYLPLYYPQGLLRCFVVKLLSVVVFAAALYRLRTSGKSRGVSESIITTLVNMFAAYAVMWTILTFALWIKKSSYLDTAAEPFVVVVLHLIETLLRAGIPTGLLYALTTSWDAEREALEPVGIVSYGTSEEQVIMARR